MASMVKAGQDIRKIIEKMTDEEKKQALALLQGMLIGKELAEKDKTA